MSLHRFEPCLPIPLEDKDLLEIISKSIDFVTTLDKGLGAGNLKNDYIAPFTLFPSAFPQKEFERVVELQPLVNELTHKVAHNYEFLRESLKSTLMADDFTAKLFAIYEKVRHEGRTQRLSLGLLRADVMLELEHEGYRADEDEWTAFCCCKQVEVNTIAAGFAGLGPIFSEMHRYVLSELGHGDLAQRLPENRALQGLAQGFIEAWKLYNNPLAVILFVVGPDASLNLFDQRLIEYEIGNINSNVKVIRKTLSQLSKEAGLEGSQRKLVVGGMEIAVVYYRAGYKPSYYRTHSEWDVRLLIERSFAIKCPSIEYQLAGCKKVQQALARPNIVEKILSSPDKASRVQKVFTGLYSLDIDEADNEAAIEMALSDPESYVLKPQREGGGNNFYGTDIAKVLNKIKETSERNAFILMDKIKPPVVHNYLIKPSLRNAAVRPVDTVCELGIFGVIIGDENSILVNKQVGHMMRTKHVYSEEGGVSKGLGFVDSPFLF